MEDTIAAISTPPGEGGIGIVRISGKDAKRICLTFFKTGRKNNELEPRRVYYGNVVDPDSADIIDEAVVLYMQGPRSYTTQDVIEINCHGSPIVLKRTLELAISSGARLAEPGEFTMRAFLGGRMDLAQAEAVMDVIRAKTDDSRRVALSQLKGGLSAKINELREDLIDFLVQLEARIDFCEHDIPPLEPEYKTQRIGKVLEEAKNILSGFEKGKIYREGIRVCIAGPPNVGKSTLLNTLLGEERAIVTHIPGTTRDKIEETVNLKGVPLVLADTAGLRETGDLVESIGIEKTIESINNSDLTILVIDGSKPDGGGLDFLPQLPPDKKTLVILNKSDLGIAFDKTKLSGAYKPETIIETSLLNKKGVEKIEDRILNLVFGGGLDTSSEIIISNVRHRDAVARCTLKLEEAQSSVAADMPDDFITIDLKAALDELGEIVGKTTAGDLIHRIFADFCIGK